MRRRILLVVGAAWVLTESSGCYSPDGIDCAVTCSADGECPEGMSCSNDLCVRSGGSCMNADAEVCREATVRCRDSERLVSCDPATQKVVEVGACTGSTPICMEGLCVECALGNSRCDGSEVERCSQVAGRISVWWVDGAVCSDDRPICSLGACSATVGVAVGATHACARLTDGGVRCWGGNTKGQLGLGDTADRGDRPGSTLATITWPGVSDVRKLAAGGGHTCAITSNGRLLCWGQNDRGQLGLGDTEHRGHNAASVAAALTEVDLGSPVRDVSLGSRHSCAILASGRVKCWGANDFGQLGLDGKNDRGDEPGEMGEALPEVALGGDVAAVEISAGGAFSCARLATGEVKCWGSHELGQLGSGEGLSAGSKVPKSVRLSSPAKQISAGYAHACALLDSERVVCWGGFGTPLRVGHGGDTNQGHTPDEFIPVALGAHRARAVSAGSSHSCAVLDDGRIACWGGNQAGALGNGSADTKAENNLQFVDLGNVAGAPFLALDVHAGGEFTCALSLDHDVKCWGLNANGQLGVFDTENRGDQPLEMGDALPVVPLD